MTAGSGKSFIDRENDLISPDMLALLVDNMNSGFLVSDSVGNVLYCNRAYRKLTKLHDLKVGDSILSYTESGAIKGEPACIAVVREKKKIIRKFVQTEEGVFIVSSSEPVFNKEGDVRTVVTRVHDMTEFVGIRDDIEKVRTIIETMVQDPAKLRDYGENVIALSRSMTYVLDMADKVAGFDLSVLLTGESGSGKDVIAHFIHERSPRAKDPFVAVNCAAIPADLLETELFGYEKGTFTGQKMGGKEGLLAAVRGGTLFLDEIGDMPLGLQAKILRVLETRQFRPVGGSVAVDMNARVFSATNHDLKKMIEEGKFREDLYYRIKVVELRVPPLRERPEDIIPLTLFFLKRFNEKYKLDKSISVVELQKLQSYKWPGNVRELRNTVEMMYALSPGKMLEAPMGNRQTGSYSGTTQNHFTVTADGSWVIPESGDCQPVFRNRMSESIRKHSEGGGHEAPFSGDTLSSAPPAPEEPLATLESYVNEAEKKYLERAYRECGTTRKMAEKLGVNHSTIMRKLKKHKIRVNELNQ